MEMEACRGGRGAFPLTEFAGARGNLSVNSLLGEEVYALLDAS